MSRPSSATTVFPQEGRVRLNSEPACRDVTTARAPPWPGVSSDVQLLSWTKITE
jgi:hypothetical protein